MCTNCRTDTADVEPEIPGQDTGYVGPRTDPTPDRHYTVPGILAGLPTPETTAGRCRTPQPCIDADDWEA